jgi:autotransporter-associated beta strand protein
VNEGELRIRGSSNRLPITTPVTVNSPGILNLNGVSQQIGSLSGNGLVGLANALLTVGDATSTSFSGSIRDTANAGAAGATTIGGRVTKVGAGTLTFTGASTYTGATTISAGTLIVAGSLTGTASVGITGTLGGGGIITTASAGNISLLANGKLSPGASIGNLTANLSGGGGFSLTAGVTASATGALVYELDTPAASDKVTLSGGPLVIGAGVLEFDDFSFTTSGGFGPGDYVLFDGNTAVSGTFGALTTGTVGGFGAELQLADGGNDLILRVVPEPGSAVLLAGALGLLMRRRRA